jgi:hypothetical protein
VSMSVYANMFLQRVRYGRSVSERESLSVYADLLSFFDCMHACMLICIYAYRGITVDQRCFGRRKSSSRINAYCAKHRLVCARQART